MRIDLDDYQIDTLADLLREHIEGIKSGEISGTPMGQESLEHARGILADLRRPE